MSGNKKGLSTATVWLMIGVALFFDLLSALLNLIVMGWILVPIQYATFYVWFKMHGLNFFSLKRAPSIAIGSIFEILSAGILPAFTFIVARVALTAKLKNVTVDNAKK